MYRIRDLLINGPILNIFSIAPSIFFALESLKLNTRSNTVWYSCGDTSSAHL